MIKILNFLKVSPVFSYFVRVFKKDEKGEFPKSSNLKLMHGINKISIIMFIVAIIILAIKYITYEY